MAIKNLGAATRLDSVSLLNRTISLERQAEAESAFELNGGTAAQNKDRVQLFFQGLKWQFPTIPSARVGLVRANSLVSFCSAAG